jgi:hypothetical protein
VTGVNRCRTLERAQFDDLYNIRPYYIAPEGKLGAEAFVTIREAIEATGKLAIGRWLGTEPGPRELLTPFPAEPMTMWPMSTRVNSPRNDDATLINPLSEAEPTFVRD